MTEFQRTMLAVQRETRLAELQHRLERLAAAVQARKGAAGITELRNRLAAVTRELLGAELHG
jgi:hypothetical protein